MTESHQLVNNFNSTIVFRVQQLFPYLVSFCSLWSLTGFFGCNSVLFIDLGNSDLRIITSIASAWASFSGSRKWNEQDAVCLPSWGFTVNTWWNYCNDQGSIWTPQSPRVYITLGPDDEEHLVEWSLAAVYCVTCPLFQMCAGWRIMNDYADVLLHEFCESIRQHKNA